MVPCYRNIGEERKTTPKISELIVKAFGVKRIIYQFRVLFTWSYSSPPCETDIGSNSRMGTTHEYYDTQILADISWTSLSSEVNNLPLIYTELENYFFPKFEGWQLSHRCTCILNLQLRLYEVNRWWSERCFPFVAQTRNKPLNFWSLSTRVFSAPHSTDGHALGSFHAGI